MQAGKRKNPKEQLLKALRQSGTRLRLPRNAQERGGAARPIAQERRKLQLRRRAKLRIASPTRKRPRLSRRIMRLPPQFRRVCRRTCTRACMTAPMRPIWMRDRGNRTPSRRATCASSRRFQPAGNSLDSAQLSGCHRDSRWVLLFETAGPQGKAEYMPGSAIQPVAVWRSGSPMRRAWRAVEGDCGNCKFENQCG